MDTRHIGGIIRRAQDVITRPRATWPIIAAEPADIRSLYRSYIAVLAAVPAVAMVLGLTVFSRFTLPGHAIYTAISGYVASLISPLVAALVLQWLAPRFQSTGTTVDALKLVAYASTPAWAAGVLYLLPVLSPLVAVAVLYAIYLFYLGLPATLKTPPEQIVPFMVVSAILILVVNIVLNALIAQVRAPYPGF